MSLLIESKKLKRTGYLPAFLAGGFLAAAFPVVYMMVKAEEMTALAGNPINILMSANWQMMAMLNILISICGIETVVFGIAEVLYLQVRRCFE